MTLSQFSSFFLKKERCLPMEQAENHVHLKQQQTERNLERLLPAVIALRAISQAMLLESAVSYLCFFVEATISLYQTVLLGYPNNAIFG